MTPVTAGSYWIPPASVEWQWEIDHPLSLSSPTDMGTNDLTYTGAAAPAPTVFDIDGILNPASTVAGLHALGDHAIAYLEVGSAGNYYTAADEGQATTWYAQLQADGDFAGSLSGYPEQLLNINSPTTVAIVEQQIALAASKGFDAIEPDLDETFGGNEGATSVTITQADEVNYLTTLSNYAHSLGLAWFVKNPDDTGSQSFVDAVAPISQGVITEQCNQYSSCSLLQPFLAAGKPVLNAEYSGSASSFCPADNAADISGNLFPQSLNGTRTACR